MKNANSSPSSSLPDDDDADPIAHQQTYVLVHGAWQASYVWDVVSADLLQRGHKVIVVELPGHGGSTWKMYRLKRFFIMSVWGAFLLFTGVRGGMTGLKVLVN